MGQTDKGTKKKGATMSGTAVSVVFERAEVLGMLAVAGYQTGKKWKNDQLCRKLRAFKDVYDPTDADVQTRLVEASNAVKAAIERTLSVVEEAGGDADAVEFEVTGDDPVGGSKAKSVSDGATDDEKAAKKAEKEAAKAAKKAEREAAKAAKKAEKAANKKTERKTRWYYAGQVLSEVGVEDGTKTNEDLIRKFNAAYPDGDLDDSTLKYTIRLSIQVLQGFLGKDVEGKSDPE